MDAIIKALGAFAQFLQSSRLSAIGDKSAWLLIAPAFAALYAIEPSLALTLGQWVLFGVVLAGAAVIISRIVFPQINLSELVRDAVEQNNTAAGLIVASVVLFVALMMLALVVWSKA